MRTQDEKTMAMLAHGSAILNIFTGFGGIVVALLIYYTQKDKSVWVGFQALQALVYQVVSSVIVWFAVIISSLLMSVVIGCLLLPVSLLLGLAVIGYSAYAAYQTYQGVDFRYLWLGDWLAGQQNPPPSA